MLKLSALHNSLPLHRQGYRCFRRVSPDLPPLLSPPCLLNFSSDSLVSNLVFVVFFSPLNLSPFKLALLLRPPFLLLVLIFTPGLFISWRHFQNSLCEARTRVKQVRHLEYKI